MKVRPVMYGERRVFPVAAFNRGVAWYLGRLPEVWVEGEVTELRRADAWATVFLTLKDPASAATLRVTMPRGRFDALDLTLADGEKVQVLGHVELYEVRGDLAFRAATIERVGVGDHLAAIERLKQQLAAEGLFASERKRPLPRFPRAVGVLTGKDAAARGDILTAIGARYPAVRVVVRETRVQGAGAEASITRGLEALARRGVDVIVIARGGGSLDDLLPFSSEQVVRAVAASRVPVVSAVGHEQDTPLCDLAADARASTPTAAARLVVPDAREVRGSLDRLRERLSHVVSSRTERARERLDDRRRRLRVAPGLHLERRRAGLDRSGARLQALSPRATLERGYAIVRAHDRAVRDADAVTLGDTLAVELARGSLTARVTRVDAGGPG